MGNAMLLTNHTSKASAQLYEARIPYQADKSCKHNSLIQAFNNRTLILSAEKRPIYRIVLFGG